MLRVFEGVHAGSVLESEELYNSEEVYKIDSQHLLQSEEESEIKSDKLSPKEQIELDLITRTLVVILNNYSQENELYETEMIDKVSKEEEEKSRIRQQQLEQQQSQQRHGFRLREFRETPTSDEEVTVGSSRTQWGPAGQALAQSLVEKRMEREYFSFIRV